MRGWLVVGLLVLAAAYVRWMQRRIQLRQLGHLVHAAAGDATRGRRATYLRQVPALVAALAAVAVATYVEQQWRLFWVRIPLCLLVVGVYAPYASALAPATFKRLQRGPADRMMQMGAPPPVAHAIAKAGRPFALVGSIVMLAAVLVLAWHHAAD